MKQKLSVVYVMYGKRNVTSFSLCEYSPPQTITYEVMMSYVFLCIMDNVYKIYSDSCDKKTKNKWQAEGDKWMKREDGAYQNRSASNIFSSWIIIKR